MTVQQLLLTASTAPAGSDVQTLLLNLNPTVCPTGGLAIGIDNQLKGELRAQLKGEISDGLTSTTS